MGQKRLSITTRMFLVAASFALPIAVLAYFVVANINEAIDFARWEVMGNAVQRPLESLLEGVLKAEIATQQCEAGDAGCSATLATAKGDVATSLDGVDAALRQHGTALQFTAEGLGKRDRGHLTIENLRTQWRQIAEAYEGPGSPAPADLSDQYGRMVADVRAMITHAGDTSNLILDPDLDSYYLMDVTLLALPQTQDRIAATTLQGAGLLRSGIAPADRVQLAVAAALLQQSDLERVVASAQTSLKEDANFYGTSATLAQKLTPALAAYRQAAARFIDLTNELASSATPALDAAAYTAAGLAALDASFRLWDVSVRELDDLLETRIATRVQARTRALLLSALALIAACLLAYVTARSISRPLDSLVQTLGPGATLLGQCVDSIAEASRKESTTPEEAAIICEELNAHADDMRRAAAELVAQVKGGRVDGSDGRALGHTALEQHLGTA